MKILNVSLPGASLTRCCLVMCLALLATTLTFGQYAEPDKLASVSIAANGSGIMVAGNLWDSYMPANKGPYYGEAANTLVSDALRIGNFDRQWSTPTHMWPGGYDHGNFWNKDIYISVFDPDATFNPATVGGVTNPAYFGSSGPNYAMASYVNKPGLNPKRVVLGAGDPARDYARETHWVDATTRHHALYEAGYPTNVGVDVKIEVHQYTLHWNNFNDFIMVKLRLKNTGTVDIDADGVAEKTNHRIAALALSCSGENMSIYQLSNGAGRTNR